MPGEDKYEGRRVERMGSVMKKSRWFPLLSFFYPFVLMTQSFFVFLSFLSFQTKRQISGSTYCQCS
jgi:hypothetical protein